MRQLTLLPLILLAGCEGTEHVHSGTEPEPVSQVTPSPATPRDIYAGSPEVVRYDRYTLVGISPDKAQRDLLNQMTDISMPPETIRTVGDALRYALIESGWSLCPASGSLPVLYERPLPAVQRHLGPVRPSEALQLLAGPAWKMQADQVMRQICFTLRPGFAAPTVMPVTSPTPLIPSSPPPQTRYGNIDVTRINTDTVIPAWSPTGRGKATLPVVLKRILPAGWKASLSPDVKKQPAGHATVLAWQGDRDWQAVLDELLRANGWRAAINPDARTVVITPSPPVTPAAATQTPPAVTAATATPVQKPVSTPVWKAEPGTTLREFLTRQASTVTCPAGGHWIVHWPVNVDYPISAPQIFHGTFDAMIGRLFTLYGTAGQVDTPLYAQANRIQCVIAVSDKPGGR
ncbi:PFGI-1 class ICE element type IV pilus protein PilL2 [Klebsiella quasivariicola]|uniref:PFGI-1 class ICE element type IV pilus protein PilL2 n=1 Tax=Klebsiella quasivariicola TaxID=2026240 RepID=UPI001CCA6150|nr:TcpQ domain-containing protein [Klebsiella quasivariicola]MBZ9582959.1 TcpQ domain-containing protein [Klebsiella quasivariicola]